MQCLKRNIAIKSKHVPGTMNCLCDLLSRFQLQKFKQLAPHADPEPYPVPDLLWEVFKKEHILY